MIIHHIASGSAYIILKSAPCSLFAFVFFSWQYPAERFLKAAEEFNAVKQQKVDRRPLTPCAA